MRTVVRVLVAHAIIGALVAGWTMPTAAAGPLSQRCANAQDGFSVSYPSDWYTNEPGSTFGSPVDTCTLFAPFDDIEILPEAVNVPVMLKVESGTLPDGVPITIDGRPGVLIRDAELGGRPADLYYARLTDSSRFAAFAMDNGSAPFDESRAVLDAMIATVDLDEADSGPSGGEPVVLALTLSGDVVSSDTFGIYRQCEDASDCHFIHDLEMVCTGDALEQELYSLPECEARTYELAYSLPAGAALEYGVVRWDGSLEGNLTQHMLRDSVRIPEGGITLRLGYDYSLGSAPPPALPDTAMPRGGMVPAGLLLVAASLLLWCGSAATRRARQASEVR